MIQTQTIQVRAKYILNEVFNEPEGSSEKISIPEYQRRNDRWSVKTQSEFILDILQNMPVSPIIVGYYKDQNKRDLIDGLQRLTTLNEFRKDGFKLVTEEHNNWTNKIYSELSFQDKSLIDNFELEVRKYNGIVDMEQSYNFFLKANAGVPLTKFEKAKGYKECFSLLKLVESKELENTICGLLDQRGTSRDEKLISTISLSEGFFKSTFEFKSQWQAAENLDVICSNYLNKDNWIKVGKFITLLDLPKGIKQNNKGLIFLSCLLMVKPHLLVNLKNEFQTLLNEDFFNEKQEDIVIAGSGKKSGAPSRQKRRDRIYTKMVEIIKSKDKTYYSKKEKLSKLEEQKNLCAECDCYLPIEFAEGDHKHPQSKGGKTTYDNLQVVCKKCNLEKSDKVLIAS